MTDDFGPVANPGYFVLPLDARLETSTRISFPCINFTYLFDSLHVFCILTHTNFYPSTGWQSWPRTKNFSNTSSPFQLCSRCTLLCESSWTISGETLTWIPACGGEELDIYLTPVAGKPNVYATQIANEWNAKLHQVHKDAGMKFFSLSPHMVTLDREDGGMHSPIQMNEVVEWLVEDSRVADILLRPRFFMSNQYAAAVAQIDPATLAPVGQTGNGQPAYGVPVLTTPLHDKNIDGQGQVVGVGDMGLHYDAVISRTQAGSQVRSYDR